jgi:hypothetical protein
MKRSNRGPDGVSKPVVGESNSLEDARLEKERDNRVAAEEAAKEGISVESYLHMRINQANLYRFKRLVKRGNEETAKLALSDPTNAKKQDAVLQAQVNGLLGLGPDIDPVTPEPRNRGGAPRGNKNAAKRRRKTTPH